MMTQQKTSFKAFRIEEENGSYSSSIQNIAFNPLKENDILVKVHFSSINYKDALSASGNKGVTRSYPHTPGIDAVGTIEKSNSPSFEIGEEVIVTSFDLGMNTDGGFAEYIQVPAAWAVKLPLGLSMKEAMTYGTAGFTAAMSIKRITESIKPKDGKIVVSGATGGVGALSVAILSKLGYTVVAITGKETERDYLLRLGAKEILPRSEVEKFDNKPLLKPLFAGAVDTVGGLILENILKATQPLGVVTCCGNVASPKLELTVFPFILRGIALVGIDSQNYPLERRSEIWNLLTTTWKPDHLAEMGNEIRLSDLQDQIGLMLQSKLKGRTIVNLAQE